MECNMKLCHFYKKSHLKHPIFRTKQTATRVTNIWTPQQQQLLSPSEVENVTLSCFQHFLLLSTLSGFSQQCRERSSLYFNSLEFSLPTKVASQCSRTGYFPSLTYQPSLLHVRHPCTKLCLIFCCSH